ncbi:MAG TPA: DUF2953 domain-containing protein [Methanothrix sp.]|nr:DUF2953 domain-containing protein [Methanothrix sp.]
MPSILLAVALLSVFLLLLAGLLLVVPVRLSINLRKDGPAVQGGYSLNWLGLAVKRGEIGKAKAGQQEAAEKRPIAAEEDSLPDEKKHVKMEGEKADGQDGSAAPDIGSIISAAPALADILFDLLRRIRLRKFSCRICFGLDDPADTATAYGCLWSLAWAAGLLSSVVSGGLSIQPYFEGERLEGELAADLEGWPVYALAAALRALWIRETRMLLKESMGWA